MGGCAKGKHKMRKGLVQQASFLVIRLHLIVKMTISLTLLAFWTTSVGAGMPDPWRYTGAYPTGADLHAVWAAAEDDVFVGGSGGAILRWNGTEWETMETPTQKTIYDIHGVSASDVWAVGGDLNASSVTDGCVILHFDGSSWVQHPSPAWGGWTYPLAEVHALAADDVWAIPNYGTLVANWDGDSWQLEAPIPTAEGRFNDLTGAPPDHIYIVGSHGQILHRTGGAWAMERKTESGGLSTDVIKSVWALDAETVWAGSNAVFNAYDLLKRGGSGTWSEVVLNQKCGLDSIWGSSASEVYFVQTNAVCLFDGSTVQQSWDFSAGVPSTSGWTRAHGAGDSIFAVGPAQVHEVAMGTGSQGTTALTMKASGAPISRQLAGTTPYGDSDILAWGGAEIMVLGEVEGIPLHSRPAGGDSSSAVTAMLAPEMDDLYMSWSGGLHHYDGSSWSPVLNQYGGSQIGVKAFWRSPSGTVFCINAYQLLKITSGLLWELVHQDYSIPFSAILGTSDTDILLGASDGRLFHFDGSGLVQEPGTVDGGVAFIAGFGGDFYAVGADGSAVRRDPVLGARSAVPQL